MKVYRDIESLPTGQTDENCITEGCLAVEGGGWRGLYAAGVIDGLMKADINLQTTVGVSAGALCGVAYVSGQIGLNAHIDLTFRNDPNFVGRGAILHEHGIMGLRYMFNELMKTYPIDKRRFTDKRRELAVVATSLETGKPVYFLKNSYHNIIGATVASASVPYVSKPVMLDGEPFLDGGCTEKIPYEWAKMMGFEKIVVIRTRQREYRRETKPLSPIAKALYHSYPKFLTGLDYAEERYNEVCDELDRDEAAGKVFVIAPDGPVDVSKFEKDLDKLGDLYYRGYHDGEAAVPALKKYLS